MIDGPKSSLNPIKSTPWVHWSNVHDTSLPPKPEHSGAEHHNGGALAGEQCTGRRGPLYRISRYSTCIADNDEWWRWFLTKDLGVGSNVLDQQRHGDGDGAPMSNSLRTKWLWVCPIGARASIVPWLWPTARNQGRFDGEVSTACNGHHRFLRWRWGSGYDVLGLIGWGRG
jgi:hypothetical protein